MNTELITNSDILSKKLFNKVNEFFMYSLNLTVNGDDEEL